MYDKSATSISAKVKINNTPLIIKLLAYSNEESEIDSF